MLINLLKLKTFMVIIKVRSKLSDYIYINIYGTNASIIYTGINYQLIYTRLIKNHYNHNTYYQLSTLDNYLRLNKLNLLINMDRLINLSSNKFNNNYIIKRLTSYNDHYRSYTIIIDTKYLYDIIKSIIIIYPWSSNKVIYIYIYNKYIYIYSYIDYLIISYSLLSNNNNTNPIGFSIDLNHLRLILALINAVGGNKIIFNYYNSLLTLIYRHYRLTIHSNIIVNIITIINYISNYSITINRYSLVKLITLINNYIYISKSMDINISNNTGVLMISYTNNYSLLISNIIPDVINTINIKLTININHLVRIINFYNDRYISIRYNNTNILSINNLINHPLSILMYLIP